MLRIIYAIIMILHGLIHFFYAAHSHGLFEIKKGLKWPQGSWAFSKFLGNNKTRHLASILYLLVTIGFAVGGIVLLIGLSWWQPLVLGAAGLSSLSIFLFWNGTLRKLDDQGGLGLLINLAILASQLLLHWPHFAI